jgi:hypothetical protein
VVTREPGINTSLGVAIVPHRGRRYLFRANYSAVPRDSGISLAARPRAAQGARMGILGEGRKVSEDALP